MKSRDGSYRQKYGDIIGPILRASVMKHARVGRHGTAAEKAADRQRHYALKAALEELRHLLP
jgi:hypothetical protein